MYIEDLVQLVVVSVWHNGQDQSFLQSIADQLAFQNLALTEKQGTHTLKILNKHKDAIRNSIPHIDRVLDTPQWKHAFRVLPKVKTISIGIHNQPAKFFNGKCVLVEFPYDQNLVETFKKRNSSLHELHKGQWDANLKKWIFALTEKNISWLGDILVPQEFIADQEFIELYNSIKQVRDNIEHHMPMVSTSNGQYTIINAHKSVPQPKTSNLAQTLFFAKEYGINTWDDAVDSDIDSGKVSSATKNIVAHSSKFDILWLDSTIIEIEQFRDAVQYGGPILIIVPGGSELENLQQWVQFALNNGVDIDQISVMFRLPNDQADFNRFVKEAALNSPITERTRMVFVSTKITKPLVKSGIRFNTVINLGYYNYMHFTMSTIVDNATNLVYYSMKAPTKRTQWRQHELS